MSFGWLWRAVSRAKPRCCTERFPQRLLQSAGWKKDCKKTLVLLCKACWDSMLNLPPSLRPYWGICNAYSVSCCESTTVVGCKKVILFLYAVWTETYKINVCCPGTLETWSCVETEDQVLCSADGHLRKISMNRTWTNMCQLALGPRVTAWPCLCLVLQIQRGIGPRGYPCRAVLGDPVINVLSFSRTDGYTDPRALISFAVL